jgi:Tfp pilus assembly protein PilN
VLKINLLPPRVRAARAKRLMIAAAAGAAAVLLTIPAGFWYARWSSLAALRAELALVEAEARKPEYADVIKKVEELKAQEAAVAKKLEVLAKLLGRQATWIRVFEILSDSQSQARDLWLTAVQGKTLTAGKDAGKIEMTVQGMAYSVGSVGEFVEAFKRSELAPEAQGQNMTQATAEDGHRIIRFQVQFKFKV